MRKFITQPNGRGQPEVDKENTTSLKDKIKLALLLKDRERENDSALRLNVCSPQTCRDNSPARRTLQPGDRPAKAEQGRFLLIREIQEKVKQLEDLKEQFRRYQESVRQSERTRDQIISELRRQIEKQGEARQSRDCLPFEFKSSFQEFSSMDRRSQADELREALLQCRRELEAARATSKQLSQRASSLQVKLYESQKQRIQKFLKVKPECETSHNFFTETLQSSVSFKPSDDFCHSIEVDDQDDGLRAEVSALKQANAKLEQQVGEAMKASSFYKGLSMRLQKSLSDLQQAYSERLQELQFAKGRRQQPSEAVRQRDEWSASSEYVTRCQ